MLLQLSLCIATIIQMTSTVMTSSPLKFRCVQQGNDSDISTEQMFIQLQAAGSQLQRSVFTLKTAISQLQSDHAQLMRAASLIEDVVRQTEDEEGKHEINHYTII